MPFTTPGLNALVSGLIAAGTRISLHTADPGTTGASEVTGGTYARVATTWGSPASGSAAGSEVSLNVPAGTTVTHWGLWSAATGGTFLFGGALAAAEAFGAAGTQKHTPTITASN